MFLPFVAYFFSLVQCFFVFPFLKVEKKVVFFVLLRWRRRFVGGSRGVETPTSLASQMSHKMLDKGEGVGEVPASGRFTD